MRSGMESENRLHLTILQLRYGKQSCRIASTSTENEFAGTFLPLLRNGASKLCATIRHSLWTGLCCFYHSALAGSEGGGEGGEREQYHNMWYKFNEIRKSIHAERHKSNDVRQLPAFSCCVNGWSRKRIWIFLPSRYDHPFSCANNEQWKCINRFGKSNFLENSQFASRRTKFFMRWCPRPSVDMLWYCWYVFSVVVCCQSHIAITASRHRRRVLRHTQTHMSELRTKIHSPVQFDAAKSEQRRSTTWNRWESFSRRLNKMTDTHAASAIQSNQKVDKISNFLSPFVRFHSKFFFSLLSFLSILNTFCANGGTREWDCSCAQRQRFAYELWLYDHMRSVCNTKFVCDKWIIIMAVEKCRRWIFLFSILLYIFRFHVQIASKRWRARFVRLLFSFFSGRWRWRLLLLLVLWMTTSLPP